MILDGGVVLKKINLLLFVMVVCSVIVLAADPVNVKISVPSSITKNVPFDIDVTLDSTDQSVTAIVLYVTSQEGKVTFNSANRDGTVWFSGKEPGQNMLVTVGGKSMWYFKLGPFGSTTETSNVDKKIFTLKATASEGDTILIYNPNSESKIFKGITKYQMNIVPAVVTLAGLECVPTCPSPSTVCKGVTETSVDEKCNVNCNVVGTKTTNECLDTDGDGVAVDKDNCPSVANMDQADSNNNGVGDICEPVVYCDINKQNKEDCVIQFKDTHLKAAVKKELALNDGQEVTLQTAKTTFILNDLYSEIIADLSGLEFFTALTSLNLAQNKISDISALSGLTKLQILYLPNNKLNDLSPLKDLKNLNSLDTLLQQEGSKLSFNCQKFIGGENNEANKKAVAEFLKQCASACPNLPPDKITEEGNCNVIGDFNGDNNVDSQDISTIKEHPDRFWEKITEGFASLQKFVSSMITNLGSK